MKTQKIKYDTYCTHPECINNQNAFFVYPNHYHSQKNHKTKPLHPLTVIQTIESLPQEQQTLLVNEKNELLKKVGGYISQFGDRLKSFVTDKYLSSFLTSTKTELTEIKVLNPDQIAAKLQEGDHQLLKEYISYCENGAKNKFAFYSYTQNKIKQMDAAIIKEMEELYGAFQKIISVTFERKEDFLKVAEGQFEAVTDLGKDQIRKTFRLDEVSPRLMRNVTPNILSNQSSIEDVQNNNYDNYSAEQITNVRKRKPISKPDKKPKITFEHRKPEEKKVPKAIDIASQITQLAPDQIRINTCSYSQLTYEYIKKHYKDLTKIHIFHHKFGRKEIIKRLFTYYKNLKIITLNCNHEFQSSLMPQNRQMLQKIENLQLKWDFNNFFREYHIFKFFPSKPPRQVQNLKKNNIDINLLLALKNNQSLVINNSKQIDELLMSSFRFEKVKSLHYMKALEDKQKLLDFSKLLQLNQLSQLRILHLFQINLYDNERQFSQFLQKNKEITTLVLSCCKLSPSVRSIDTPVKSFQYLRELPNLKKFSFMPYSSEQYVKTENIFCLSNLQELHLGNCNLLGTNKYYSDSSMLREINNLRKLTQLSLYACNPIFSDFFTYMQKETLQNISFLNIGYTQVDNVFGIKIIPFMTKLEYLNIDSTSIDGKSLLAGFQSYSEKHQKQSPLKYLSIQSTLNQYHFDTSQMRRLSAYIPHLTYAQISNCRDLRGYGFEQYKNLKQLAVDNEQEPLIQRKISQNVQLINLSQSK